MPGHPQPQNPLAVGPSKAAIRQLENDAAVMKSLKSVTAAPQLRVEVLPWRTGIEVKQYHESMTHEAELTACADSSASSPFLPSSTAKQRTLCQGPMA